MRKKPVFDNLHLDVTHWAFHVLSVSGALKHDPTVFGVMVMFSEP